MDTMRLKRWALPYLKGEPRRHGHSNRNKMRLVAGSDWSGFPRLNQLKYYGVSMPPLPLFFPPLLGWPCAQDKKRSVVWLMIRNNEHRGRGYA